jgi:hypothetical protein
MIELASKKIATTLTEIVDPSRRARNPGYDVVMALKLMDQMFFDLATSADVSAIWRPQ